ncbi:acyl-ACP thioesterase domain-containing protein [Streptococcus plurextorum]|uniref:acyl-ACP thioesterase domain-containing protein n=1 Tax=Streptococcus plurextorum TaxID=456876 RepID=UPI0004240D21|nr:acyl-ACP thioesterase domain-containing protein [Streptococcus plurextorum]
MGQVYREDFVVPFDMVNMEKEIVLSRFMSYCLGVSGRQSAGLNRSDTDIYEQYGLIWVVTDYHFDIQRLPRYDERVVIETEAVAFDKFLCQRRFNIRDEVGQVLLTIDCYFVLLDFDSRKLAPVPEDLIAPYQSEKVKKIPRLIKWEKLSDYLTINHAISYFDMDMNRHVNNGTYLNWLFDSMDWPMLKDYRAKELTIKYLKEISCEDFLETYVNVRVANEGLATQYEIYNQGQLRAQARIVWQKVEEEDDR